MYLGYLMDINTFSTDSKRDLLGLDQAKFQVLQLWLLADIETNSNFNSTLMIDLFHKVHSTAEVVSREKVEYPKQQNKALENVIFKTHYP